ncbi:MAG: carboxypeptidase-like regulatory domain-containing protein [Planctomycetaceae bacterium]|nr:carboxypeptidase-like regulatory domain-containing protein [Planctomycetaceae bacterium]
MFNHINITPLLIAAFLFLGTATAQQRNEPEKVKIPGKVVLPDGTAPEQCDLTAIVTTPPRSSGFPFYQTSGGGRRMQGNKLRQGEPFEVEASVGADVLLMAGTAHGFSTHSGPGIPYFSTGFSSGVRVYPQDVYVSEPYQFSAAKENEDIVLRLEKATPVTGKLRYDDGTPAIGVAVSAWQPTPSTRADNPRARNDSLIGTSESTDADGNFDLRLWTGEFTLATGGMPWMEPVTQKIVVEQGKPIEVELTLPTPLRVNVVMPDGEPAGNFRLSHLAAYRPVNQPGSRYLDVEFMILYNARNWRNDRPTQRIVPERPIAINLCREENYVAVMTEDNEFGIVRKLEPELMGQELTLTLKPTIEGTVKLTDGSKRLVATQEVSILMRIMKQERNGDYAESYRSFAPSLWFFTDSEGRMDFKVPVFEGIDDSVWLYFQHGKNEWNSGGGSSTSRSGSFFRNSRADERFKQFRPPADGKAFDLGVMEMEW